MASWQPEQYLRFEEERTRPCRDLVKSIEVSPRTVIDLGCGPGNSTAVLVERWPSAEVTGLDSSDSMLGRATSASTPVRWMQQDIAEWAAQEEPLFDIVFSNAALHWVGEHATIFPLLMRRVAPGGVLAVQMPADVNAPAHRIMREHFPGGGVREWFVHEPPFYYDLLAQHARRIHLWTTEYLHVLPNVEAIADWYRSTGLRPFLQALADDGQREQFVRDYVAGLRHEFHPRLDGCILFPFRRLFIVAEK
jgi:trans-aconitate 2-methyltransferase